MPGASRVDYNPGLRHSARSLCKILPLSGLCLPHCNGVAVIGRQQGRVGWIKGKGKGGRRSRVGLIKGLSGVEEWRR